MRYIKIDPISLIFYLYIISGVGYAFRTFYIYPTIGFGMILFGFAVLNINKVDFTGFLIFIITLGFSHLLINHMHGMGLSKAQLITFCNVGALYVLLTRNLSYKVLALIFFCFSGIVISHFVVNGYITENLFEDSSPNYVSVYSIIILSLYFIVLEKNTRDVSYLFIPMLLILNFVAIIGLSRSGIITSAFLTIGLLYYSGRNSLTKKIKALTVITAIGLIFLFYYDAFMPFLWKFREGGLDLAGRNLIYATYFEKINFETIILGVDSNNLGFSPWNFNLHNSFLFAHSNFGFFGIIVTAMMVISALRHKKYKLYSILLLAFAMRAFTDKVFFFSPFDFICYFMIYKQLFERGTDK